MKVPFFNDSPHYRTVGTVLIPPNEVREVDATLLPDYQPETPFDEPALPRPIVEVLLEGSQSALLASLPVLALEDLELLGEREQQGAARTAVLGAISEQLLSRAAATHDGQTAPPPETGQLQDDSTDTAEPKPVPTDSKGKARK